MIRIHATNILVLLISIPTFANSSIAQTAHGSTAATGDRSHGTNTSTNAAHTGPSYSFPTRSQTAALVPAYFGNLARTYGRPAGTVKGLPPCTMDSFVRNAEGMAELIYGDEGTEGPPPYEEFTEIHRIDAGIFGERSKGLTTGHRSHLPSAWGNDEFLGAEWAGQTNSADYTNRIPFAGVALPAQSTDTTSDSVR